jgi:Sensors of blue-light using FAD
MYRLVYCSAAKVPFSKSELLDLLSKARDKNQRLGITGMLLFKDGDFLQLLEGEREAVKLLFEQIEADPRHSGTLVIEEEESPERVFKDWSMGFRDLSDPEVRKLPGYSHYLNTPLVAESLARHPSAALQLLSMFKPTY